MSDLAPTPLPTAIRTIHYSRDIRVLAGDFAPRCAICGAERVSTVQVDDLQPHEPAETDGGNGPLQFPPGGILVLQRAKGDRTRIVHSVYCSRCVPRTMPPDYNAIPV